MAACRRGEARPPGDPGLVELVALPSATRVMAEEPGQLAVRIAVTAGTPHARGQREVNLVLVLDTSGSIEGEAIARTREAAQALVDRMADGDRIAIVAFHAVAEVVVASTRLDGRSRVVIARALAALAAQGTTDLASGWSLGLTELARGQSGRSLDRMVLVTDGVPNDVGAVHALLARTQAMQVPITMVCLDFECEPTLLGRIARETGGSYQYLDDAAAIAGVFDAEVLRLHELVARNVVLTLVAGPGVILDGAVLVPGMGPTQRLELPLGDLAAGELRELVIPVTVPGRRAGAMVEVLDAFLRFDDVVNQSGPRERRSYVGVKSSADPREVEASIELDIDTALHQAYAAAAVLQAIDLGRRGELGAADQVLHAGIADARRQVDARGDAGLAAQIARMETLTGELPSLYAQAQQQAVAALAAPAPEARPVDPSGGGAASPSPSSAATSGKESRSIDVDNRAIRALHDESLNLVMGH